MYGSMICENSVNSSSFKLIPKRRAISRIWFRVGRLTVILFTVRAMEVDGDEMSVGTWLGVDFEFGFGFALPRVDRAVPNPRN